MNSLKAFVWAKRNQTTLNNMSPLHSRAGLRRLAPLAIAASVGLAFSAARGDDAPKAPATTTENAALLDRVKELEAKVDQMQAKQQALDKANEQATADLVARDAKLHDQLMDVDGFTGGWNAQKQQFFLGTEDGKFYFHPGVIFQFRDVVNYRDDAKKGGSSDITDGFEIRRAKFYFDGNVFTPDLTYKFQWQDGNNGGSPTLEYGWAQYVFLKNVFPDGDLALKVGQYKDPVYKEEVIGDTNQLMVERSMANNFVGGPSVGPLIQGLDLLLTGKSPIHAELVYSDGANSGNTDFTNNRDITTTPLPKPLNYGVAGRVDYKVFGDWTDTTDLTGKNSGKHDLLDFGAAFDYTDSNGQNDFHWAVDGQYQMAQKLAVFAGVYGNDFSFRNTANGAASGRNDIAGMIEAGYSVDPAWQVIGRYSLTRLDDSFKSAGQGTFNEIAAGVNYYGPNGEWGNHAKLSVDLTFLPNGSPAATGIDYLATTEDKTEVVLRSQFQLWL